jgi:hypothetical protein
LTNADDVFLIKTASNGNLTWERSYGSAKLEDGNSVEQTTDGGYVITGYARANPTGTDYNYVLLYKTNSDGNTTGACASVTVTPTVTTLTAPTVIVPTYTLTTPAGTQNSPSTTLSNTAPIITSICNAILPAELLSFTAQCSEKATTLYWSTAAEFNNDYFVVERSPDGTQWETVGKVQGAGNSSSVRNYEYVDDTPIPVGKGGEVYYRLKQTDYDGKFEYSPVTSVRFPCQEGGVIVLPNPSSGIFSISGLLPGSEVSLYNVLGEKIFSREAEEKFMTIDIADRAKGVYFIKAAGSKGPCTQKVMVE